MCHKLNFQVIRRSIRYFMVVRIVESAGELGHINGNMAASSEEMLQCKQNTSICSLLLTGSPRFYFEVKNCRNYYTHMMMEPSLWCDDMRFMLHFSPQLTTPILQGRALRTLMITYLVHSLELGVERSLAVIGLRSTYLIHESWRFCKKPLTYQNVILI